MRNPYVISARSRPAGAHRDRRTKRNRSGLCDWNSDRNNPEDLDGELPEDGYGTIEPEERGCP